MRNTASFFIYRALIQKLPTYLSNPLKYWASVNPTCAQCSLFLEIPRIKTILGKSDFKWSNLQNTNTFLTVCLYHWNTSWMWMFDNFALTITQLKQGTPPKESSLSVSFHCINKCLNQSISIVHEKRLGSRGTATLLWKTNWTHLLEPVRLRETKGLVLSESLLEKLERRFPWFPDCCLRFSPDWVEKRGGGGHDRCGRIQKEGWGQRGK